MFEHERTAAENAIKRAMSITRTIQAELTSDHALKKADKSPVTVADFTAQAIVCRMLKDQFPEISIVAEESSAALQNPENHSVLEKILGYITTQEEAKNLLNQQNLFASIDDGAGKPADLFWTLDPIDGTKGFLRGEQYCLALALIQQGEVKLGVLGCPNLTLENNPSNSGLLISAVKGEGSQILNLQSGERKSVKVSEKTDPHQMKFVQSYESAHGNFEVQFEIAKRMEIQGDPIQMDSQVKYGMVATGDAEIYLRIPSPKSPNYKEKIWDHAAGSLVVEEAGGCVTDIKGNPLDFSRGKTLEGNTGVAVSIPQIHKRLIKTIEDINE